MAVCVVSMTLDSETMSLTPACVVHTHWAPCPRNGDPANVNPLEGADGDVGGREGALGRWALKTRQQRPFLLHHGSWFDDPDHDGPDCWCRPERFDANEVK